MRQELQQTVSSNPAPTNPAALPNPTEFDAALDEEEGRAGGGDYYASMEMHRQSELMHEQDEQLDGVFRTVGNLRQQASDMGRELEDQNVMLDEVDTLADRVGGKINNGMARIRHIVRQNEGKLSTPVWDYDYDEKCGSIVNVRLTFLVVTRYMVFFLHSGANICARTFINSRYRSVIVHQRGPLKSTASLKQKGR